MTAKQNLTESWPAGYFGGWLAIGRPDSWNPDYTTDDYIEVNRRAAYFGLGVWPPKNKGASTFYSITFTDDANNPLRPGVSYKLHQLDLDHTRQELLRDTQALRTAQAVVRQDLEAR